jgi:hypothetical protein
MKIKSEKQSSNVHQLGAEGGLQLETLWNVMGTFVDLAWGTEP